MKISNYFKTTILPIFSIIFCILLLNFVSTFSPRPILKIPRQESVSNFKLPMFQYFNFGNKRMLSSLLWISTVLQSDEEHYKAKDQNSWMFIRFNNISELEPLFKYNYIFGGIYLSIIKDDLIGASIIYNKGLKLYPDDVQLLKDAGFHFYFEVGDYVQSYPIFEKLVSLNPKSLSSTTTFARLLSSNSNKEDALKLLISRYESIEDKQSFVGIKVAENIYSLKAEIDLECLNSKKENCDKNDYEGNAYVFNGTDYSAKKEWRQFRIKKRKGK